MSSLLNDPTNRLVIPAAAPSRGSAVAWPFGAATNFALWPIGDVGLGDDLAGHETIVVEDPHFGNIVGLSS